MSIDNANVTNYARFNNYSGGINKTTSKQFVTDSQFIDGNNVVNDIAPILKSRWGKKLFSSVAFSGTISNMLGVDIRGKKRFLVSSGNGVYVDTVFGGTFSNIYTLGNTDSLQGVVIGKWCYLCNGYDLIKYDGTVVVPWSIVSPTTAPTATPTGSGTFESTNGYIYGYTYVRGMDAETDIIASTTTGAFLSKSYVAVVVKASTDSQVTGINIYRTLDGGTEYYLVEQIDNTNFSYPDNMSDTVLRESSTFNASGHSASLKKFDDAVYINGRTIGFMEDMTLVYSMMGAPEAFPGEYEGYTYPLYDGNGAYGMRIETIGSTPVAFKDKSISAIYNTDVESPSSFSYKVISENVGLLSKKSLAKGKLGGADALLFVGSDMNIWALTSSGMTEVSKPIKELLRNRPISDFQNCVGWFHDNRYFISFAYSTSGKNNNCIFYLDCLNGGWFPYSKDFGCISGMSFDGKHYIADSSGNIDQLDVSGLCTDRGNSYKMSVNTRYESAAEPERLKSWWTLNFEGIWSNIDVTLLLASGRTLNVKKLEQEAVTGGWDYKTGSNNWNGNWDGDWDGSLSQGAWDGLWNTVAMGQRGYDQTLPQGLKSKYISMIADIPIAGNVQSEIHSLSVGYSIEK